MLFSPLQLPHFTAPNRLIRSATFEGMADLFGNPGNELSNLYTTLARGGVGTIITGFTFIHQVGRAMQPGQCGLDHDDKIAPWKKVIAAVKAANPATRLVIQLAHCGRQTLPRVTGSPLVAPSRRPSPYFRARPQILGDEQIREITKQFINAAHRAQLTGAHGVQIHGAHGYLVHQFLSPYINRRPDAWGRDPFLFLGEIITGCQEKCGTEFPILVKLSAGDGHAGGITPELAGQYCARLADLQVRAVEVSYGTMDQALDIFRGGLPDQLALAHNPLFSHKPAWLKALWRHFALPRLRAKLLPFRENYNRAAARIIKQHSPIPLILVGGIRSAQAAEEILEGGDAEALAMCRPLINEPGLPRRFGADPKARSMCTNCNACAIMCDSKESLRCFNPKAKQCPKTM